MNNTAIKNIFILLFVAVLAIPLQAQVSPKQIDSIVNYAMSKFNVAGSAVAVVKDGKILHEKGYGVKSIDTKEPVDAHTNFAIASNSKAFTSVALAMLVEEGIINWEDKVKTHIPEFTMYNEYVEENFNIIDLLTHRSGLGLGAGDLMLFPQGSDFTIDDILANFQHFKPQSAFRTKWDYDNLLYLVAGEIIARKSGMTWEAFINSRIFKPLGMDNSYTSLSEITDTSNLSASHSTEIGGLRIIETFEDMINGAAGGIFSNVHDLSAWMLVQLHSGKYGEGLKEELFSETNHYEMWKIHTITDANTNPRYNSHFAGYGLGWFLSDVKGNMQVEHTGGLPGMLSKTVMIPDLDLGIIVLTNTSNDGGGMFSAITQSIIDMYLELDDFKWTDKYAEYMKSNQSEADVVVEKVWEIVLENKQSKVKYKNYIGIYEDVWFGKMEVFIKNKQLWIKSHRSPLLTGPLQFYKDETLAVKWEYQDMNADAFTMFTVDEKGKATGFTMKGISPNIDFSYDFQDLDLKRID
ncbi:serine hydrolase [Bizionia argentinensis JUB59]|uniref:Serine hydrolase n=1 Tax=Bizionia argentinensis JUB59 TaxID=1046627 RepID=G2EC03_9FLAO|nr:serine hydrolase [Bizionia argentinensis]EGV44047.1 serine hydrolase [Bizionia argentinensis JUB59]